MDIKPIGRIFTPYEHISAMPIQPKGAKDTLARIELNTALTEGLLDIEGFSHLYLIYVFHEVDREALTVIPFMDETPRGVYATRSPLRPNHIGLSIVELVSVQGAIVTVKGVDILNNTPLLDIKPYIEAFDGVASSKSGWMRASSDDVGNKRSDNRFGKKAL